MVAGVDLEEKERQWTRLIGKLIRVVKYDVKCIITDVLLK